MAEVRLFGGVEFRGPAGMTTFSGAKQRAIAGRLALDPGRPVSPEHLIDAVWGERAPATVRSSLQVHITQIRRSLANIGLADVLVTNQLGYVLDLMTGTVDVLRFEELVGRAGSLAATEPDAALDLAFEALAMWVGDPLTGTGDTPFVEIARPRLQRLRLGAMSVVGSCATEVGRVGEALAAIEPLVGEYPFDERLFEAFALLLYADGRQAEALSQLSDLRQRVLDELGLDPTPAIAELEHRILVHDARLHRQDPRTATDTSIERRNNLPIRMTTFIEPARGLETIGDYLAARRLVTIVGPGGAGKTRTATEVAATHLDQFPDGVWFIELAPVGDPDAILGALIATLGVLPQPGATALDSVLEWCRGRNALLIVDNCEHVLDAAADLIASIRMGCPTITVLATSREPLGLEGEQVHVLDMLDVETAVDLFADRAQLADSSFELGEHNRELVAALCDRLDRMPLAIELAAAHVRWMSPDELADRLVSRLQLGAADARSRPDRHQTLRDTVSWSYELLSEPARRLFDRLSVFAGAFDVPAVEAVCAIEDVDSDELMRELARLVSKSMVVSEKREAGMRLRLLDTMRYFGADNLVRRGESDAMRDAHVRYYAGLAERLDILVRGPRELEGCRLFEDAWDNLRDAHMWAIGRRNLDSAERIIRSARQYADLRLQADIFDWMMRTVELNGCTREPHPDVFAGAAEWAEYQFLPALWNDLLERGFRAAPALDHPSTALCWSAMPKSRYLKEDEFRGLRAVVGGIDQLAMFEFVASQIDTDFEWWALVWLTECASELDDDIWAVHIARLADCANRVRAPSLRAFAALYQGHGFMGMANRNVDAAIAQYEEGLRLACEVENRYVETECLRAILFSMVHRGDDKEIVARTCRVALTRLHETRRVNRTDCVLTSAALIHARAGRLECAATLLGRVRVALGTHGFEHALGFQNEIDQLTAGTREQAARIERGSTMNLDDAVALALDNLG